MLLIAIPWWAWIVLAGVLGIAEMHLPGAYLMWIAIGAAVTGGVAAVFGTMLEAQIATFAIASAISCGAGYFVYRRIDRRRRGDNRLNDRSGAMLGARGVVCETLINGLGKIRVGDTVWLAAGPDLAEGSPVVVSGVRGTRLVVEAMVPRMPAGRANASDGG